MLNFVPTGGATGGVPNGYWNTTLNDEKRFLEAEAYRDRPTKRTKPWRVFYAAYPNWTTKAHPQNQYLLPFTNDLKRDIQGYHGAMMAGVNAGDLPGWKGNSGNHFVSVVGVHPSTNSNQNLLLYVDTGWSLYKTGNTGQNAWGPSPTASKPTYWPATISNFYNKDVMDPAESSTSGHPYSAQAWIF